MYRVWDERYLRIGSGSQYLLTGVSGNFYSVTNPNEFIRSGDAPYYDIRDYNSSLHVALTGIGTGTKASVVIPVELTITGNIIIPPNFNLIFTNSGILNFNNDCTGTIRGPIISPNNVKVFNNVLSGQGAVSFTNNKSIDKFLLPWWGPPNDYSSDAQPYIQAAINSLPENSVLYTPQTQNYLLNSTLSMSLRRGITLLTEPGNPMRNTNIGSPFSSFKWNGPAGGTMLDMDRSYKCKVIGWTFEGGGTGGADRVINIDGFTAGNISTENHIIGNIINCAQRTGAKCVSISETVLSNNEFMVLKNNFFNANGYRTGYGVWMGASSNAHGHMLINNNYYSLYHGIHMLGGSFQMEGLNNFGDNQVDIWMNDQNYPIVIRGIDSENSAQFAYINGANNTILIDSNRMTTPGVSGSGIIEFGDTATYVKVSNNDITNAVNGSYIYKGTFSSNLKLITENNRYPNNYVNTIRNSGNNIYKDIFYLVSNELGAITSQIRARGIADSNNNLSVPPIIFDYLQSGTYGTNLVVQPVSGAMEWNGSYLYMTQHDGPTRKALAYLSDASGAGNRVTGISVSGGISITGAFNINAGSNITLTQVGSNSLTISSAGGGGSATNGVTGITVTGSNTISGAINFSAGSNVLLGINGNNITINSTGANSDNIAILFGSKELFSGSNNETVTFPNAFAATPKVLANIYNSSGQDILGFQLSGITTNGFSVNLSETIPGTGYNLNYFASTGNGLYTFGQSTINDVINNYYINSGSGLFVSQTDITSGISEQFISFPTILNENPTVVCSIKNSDFNTILGYQISGTTTSGYWLIFSDDVPFTGYKVNTFACNATGTGLATTVIVNNISNLINKAITGSGTFNYIPRFANQSGIITGSIYDDGLGRIGIGTTNLTYKVNLRGVTGSEGDLGINITNTDGANLFFGKQDGLNNTLLFRNTNQAIDFETIGVQSLNLTSNGNTIRGGGSNIGLTCLNRDLNTSNISLTNTGVTIGSYTALLFAQQTDNFNYAQIRGYSQEAGHIGALEMLVSSGSKANWITGFRMTVNDFYLNNSLTISGALTVQPISNSGSILNLDKKSFYVHTGYNTNDLWKLPSISSSNGRMYWLKNKGGQLLISGNSATEYLFTHQRVQTVTMLSGNSLMLANDGEDWSVFNNAAGEDWGEL